MEIEIKLTYSNRDEITEWLTSNGYIFSKQKEIQDIYFGTAKQQMTNIDRLYRIRNVVGVFQELTLKDSKKEANGIWSRREINVTINDSDEMQTILESLGCVKIKENFSVREIWTKQDIEFAFIDFSKPAELHIAEIEGPDMNTVQKEVSSIGNIVSAAPVDIFSVFDNLKV